MLSIGKCAPQRQVALNQKQLQKNPGKTVKLADAPRRAVQEAPKGSTYLAMVRPSLDPSRYASTRRPKPSPTETAKPERGDSDPEPRPASRLDDIAQLLNETGPSDAGEAPPVEMAQAEPPEVETAPEPAFREPLVSKPKVEAAKAKGAVSKPKVESARQAAADKAKADKLADEKKAKAAATKLGVAGTNWVQLAGGSNQDRMGTEYKKLSAKAGALLKSRSGYVTEGKDYFRLLVGPFPTKSEAQAFVNKLEKEGVDGFSWTRTPAQIKIEKLKT